MRSIRINQLVILWILVSLFFCFSHVFACSDPISTPAKKPCSKYGKLKFEVDTLYIDGYIDGMTYDYIRYDHLDSKIKHIELNSYGGDLEIAYWLAEFIYEHAITTNVRNSAICTSVCTLLYQAGINRTAHVSALFGYHGVRVGGIPMIRKYNQLCEPEYHHYLLKTGSNEQQKNEKSQSCLNFEQEWIENCHRSTEKLFTTYQKYGAKNDLYIDYQTFPKEKNWAAQGNCFKIVNWLMTAQEAMAYNVVTSFDIYE